MAIFADVCSPFTLANVQFYNFMATTKKAAPKKAATKKAATKKAATKKADPCWDGYEKVGNKNKAGKSVPNCVPENKSV